MTQHRVIILAVVKTMLNILDSWVPSVRITVSIITNKHARIEQSCYPKTVRPVKKVGSTRPNFNNRPVK